VRGGRTTDIASIISLLGAFGAAAAVLGCLVAGLAMPVVGAVGAVTGAGVDMFDALPKTLTASPLSQQSRILDSTGNVIATPSVQDRIIVPLGAVAPVMQKAQLAIEDSRFYEHGGVDVHGLVRALVSNAAGTSVQGGSTLTQQYVKLILQNTALQAGDTQAAQAAAVRSGLAGLTRKLRELKYSIQLEKTQSKDEILQGYLNIVYYGDQTYGVQAAARHYFAKDAKDLSLPEAAMIAGLAQSPGTTDPAHYPDRALARRDIVLDRMHELGLVTDKELADAKAVKLADMLHITAPASSCSTAGNIAGADYTYFCDYVLKWLELDPSLNDALGKTVDERKAKIFGGGITVQTTIDPGMTNAAREEILARVDPVNHWRIGSAAVSIDPTNGAVKGMAQSSTYALKQVDATQTQVNWAVDTKYGGSLGFGFGSTEKAFALVTALERGMPINATVDAKAASSKQAATYTRSDFPDACGLGRGKWDVRNDETAGGGPMSLAEATSRSINTAFVALVSQLGACNVRETETRLGLHQTNGQPVKPFPAAIILGADSVSPMTVASAYGSLGHDGIHCTPTPVSAITGPDGKPLPVPAPGTANCTHVVDPAVAHGVTALLQTVLQPGGTGAASALAGGRPAAGKTGTTNGNNETWFVGYTPQLTTAVWTGTPMDNSQVLDNVTLRGHFYPVVFGASVSAPIWKAIMDRDLSGQPNADFPAAPEQIQNAPTPG
jgi:membrane peptidoglycan carboxypeptidase